MNLAGLATLAEIDAMLARSAPGAIDDAALAGILSSAVRLVAARAEAIDGAPLPIDMRNLSATEVVVAISELLRAADLTVFDLAMWTRRAR